MTPVPRSVVDTPVSVVFARKGDDGRYDERQYVACYTTQLQETVDREYLEGWKVIEVQALVGNNPPIEIYRDRELCPKPSDIEDEMKRLEIVKRLKDFEARRNASKS